MRSSFLLKSAMFGYLIAGVATFTFAQDRPAPKLVVGIVVDQMRYEQLIRFWDLFGEEGFKRLATKGFNFQNAHYSYTPTYTGPGHATIYAGTTPAYHGICGNVWYDQATGKVEYCVEDESIEAQKKGVVGKISPHHLMSTNVADELKLTYKEKSKVISVALKDRSAVLPGGHQPDGAYWYDSKTGNWITSGYYTKELPKWVQEFNQKKQVDQLLSKDWKRFFSREDYSESLPDDNRYEKPYVKGGEVKFPYPISSLKDELGYGLLKSTPWGNTYTNNFAIAALYGEDMGRHEGTDLLLVSFSSTDYIGHQFGPRSVEVEDTYIRLDIELADLIKTAESRVGPENVLFVLTSDHGVADVPLHLEDEQLPFGYYSTNTFKDSLNNHLEQMFQKKDLVVEVMNEQVYFNQEIMMTNKKMALKVQRATLEYVRAQPFVSQAISTERFLNFSSESHLMMKAFRGYYPGRSGDIAFAIKPGWIGSKDGKGSTHGSGHAYDTHVPLMFYGWKVNNGACADEVHIEDIAPTLSQFMKIPLPSSTTGKMLPVECIK